MQKISCACFTSCKGVYISGCTDMSVTSCKDKLCLLLMVAKMSDTGILSIVNMSVTGCKDVRY